uniref:Trafficking protein particle complex 4 n=1 Tax=Nothoprocta perdicaria TaxID=30464 RepID=A0A8C6YW49_NOTPE
MATPRPCLEHTSARANSALRPCRSWRSTCAPTQHLVAELPPGLWAECSYYSCAAKHDTDLLICFGNTVGHAVLAINGAEVNGRLTADGKDIMEFLGNPANYPVSIRFGRHRLSSNEKLMLASMFHSDQVCGPR